MQQHATQGVAVGKSEGKNKSSAFQTWDFISIPSRAETLGDLMINLSPGSNWAEKFFKTMMAQHEIFSLFQLLGKNSMHIFCSFKRFPEKCEVKFRS